MVMYFLVRVLQSYHYSLYYLLAYTWDMSDYVSFKVVIIRNLLSHKQTVKCTWFLGKLFPVAFK